MLYEQVNIWDDFKGDIKSKAQLKIYLADHSPRISSSLRNPAVLICPGGGYDFIAEREGEPIALAFLAQGYNAFVLIYDLIPDIKYRQPLFDVSRALCVIRDKEEQWHTDIDKIAVCGFSAGGHLAASIGVFWQKEYILKALNIPKGQNKPNALILCYPVITSQMGISNRSSFYNLLGKNQDEKVYEEMSLEKFINKDTPPAFIWHTFDDREVHVANALIFAQGMKRNNIPFEMHIFPEGPHGLALCDERTDNTGYFTNEHVKRWFDLCVDWLKKYAFT